MNRHYLDLARLGKIALLLRREEFREVREPRSWLKPKLELGRRAQHVGKTRFRKFAPRFGGIFWKTRAQVAEGAHEPLRRKRLRGELRHLGGGRNAVRVERRREGSRGEVVVRLLVARVVGELYEIDEALQGGCVENRAFAFPHDAAHSLEFQVRGNLLACRVASDENCGGDRPLHWIDGGKRVEHRLQVVVELRARRDDGLDEPGHIGLGRDMLVRFPAGELAAHPPAHEDAVHRLHDGGRRAVGLV